MDSDDEFSDFATAPVGAAPTQDITFFQPDFGATESIVVLDDHEAIPVSQPAVTQQVPAIIATTDSQSDPDFPIIEEFRSNSAAVVDAYAVNDDDEFESFQSVTSAPAFVPATPSSQKETIVTVEESPLRAGPEQRLLPPLPNPVEEPAPSPIHAPPAISDSPLHTDTSPSIPQSTNNEPVSPAEKLKIVQDMVKLSPNSLQVVIAKLQHASASVRNTFDEDEDEVELDVEQMSDYTLRILQGLISQQLQVQQQRKLRQQQMRGSPHQTVVSDLQVTPSSPVVRDEQPSQSAPVQSSPAAPRSVEVSSPVLEASTLSVNESPVGVEVPQSTRVESSDASPQMSSLPVSELQSDQHEEKLDSPLPVVQESVATSEVQHEPHLETIAEIPAEVVTVGTESKPAVASDTEDEFGDFDTAPEVLDVPVSIDIDRPISSAVSHSPASDAISVASLVIDSVSSADTAPSEIVPDVALNGVSEPVAVSEVNQGENTAPVLATDEPRQDSDDVSASALQTVPSGDFVEPVVASVGVNSVDALEASDDDFGDFDAAPSILTASETAAIALKVASLPPTEHPMNDNMDGRELNEVGTAPAEHTPLEISSPSPPAATYSSPVAPADPVRTPIDDADAKLEAADESEDEFGDFDIAPPPLATVDDKLPATGSAPAALREESDVENADALDNSGDEFGDFATPVDNSPTIPSVTAVVPSVVDGVANADELEDDGDGFAPFETAAPVTGTENYALSDIAPVAPVETPLGAEARNSNAHEASEDDEFGDFDVAPTVPSDVTSKAEEPPVAEPVSHDDVDDVDALNDSDDEFAPFESATPQTTSSVVPDTTVRDSLPVVAEKEDDDEDFAPFVSASEPASQLNSAVAPSTVEEAEEEDFSPFAASTTILSHPTQDGDEDDFAPFESSQASNGDFSPFGQPAAPVDAPNAFSVETRVNQSSVLSTEATESELDLKNFVARAVERILPDVDRSEGEVGKSLWNLMSQEPVGNVWSSIRCTRCSARMLASSSLCLACGTSSLGNTTTWHYRRSELLNFVLTSLSIPRTALGEGELGGSRLDFNGNIMGGSESERETPIAEVILPADLGDAFSTNADAGKLLDATLAEFGIAAPLESGRLSNFDSTDTSQLSAVDQSPIIESHASHTGRTERSLSSVTPPQHVSVAHSPSTVAPVTGIKGDILKLFQQPSTAASPVTTSSTLPELETSKSEHVDLGQYDVFGDDNNESKIHAELLSELPDLSFMLSSTIVPVRSTQ